MNGFLWSRNVDKFQTNLNSIVVMNNVESAFYHEQTLTNAITSSIPCFASVPDR